ncbi:MAG TPA: biotin/lipoyl-binding protein [Myxococcales bacterium]|nr:biotin/lipoyl-binding protein [Myxococcales bacterium]HIK85480.1 biotin/lipoyl-binding protein [Myxococcales bacterium]
MANEIYLTRVGMTMTEGVVAEWFVADGDPVAKGELLYRLETEKVELDVDADDSGTVKHLVGAGTTCEPGDVVGWIYAAGEEIPDALPTGEKLASDDMPVPEPSPGAQTPSTAVGATTTSSVDVATRGLGGRVLASPAARKLAEARGIALTSIKGSGPGGRIVKMDVPEPGDGTAILPAVSSTTEKRVKASPVAKRLAQQLGIDLASIIGTGPNGRITKADVEAAAADSTSATSRTGVEGPAAGTTMAVRGMRKTIAKNMYRSLQSTAQLTMDMDVRMDDAVKLRAQLISEWEVEGVRPSYTDLVVKAVAKALALHPRMNSVMGENEISLLEEIHVGIAVALDEGLVVPVIREALRCDLKSIAVEASRLAKAARGGSLGMDDMHGGTFTVSTLGMLGVDSFTPILNPPQTGILGVNRIAEGVGWEGDRPVKRSVMRLSLTWDHRVLDGEPAARFLATVRDLLEAPYRLLL